MNEKNKRMTNFDILKGISVFLIIQIHYPSMFRKEYIDAIARIGVPLFFMILCGVPLAYAYTFT